MSVNIPALIIVGLILVVFARASKTDPVRLRDLRDRVREAVRRVVGTFGWSALAAAAILMLLPVFTSGKVEGENLRQLNAAIAYYHGLLGKSWIVLVIFLCTLLAGAWLIKAEISQATAAHAGRVVKGTAFVKGVVALLATCSFIGGDLHGRLRERLEESELAKPRLAEIRMQLFSRIERALAQELVESILDDSEDNSAFRQIRSAYRLAAPYVDQAPRPETTVLPDLTWQSGEMPDLSTRQAEQEVAAHEMEIDMGDLSLNSPIAIQPPKDLLAEQMVEIVLDEQVAKPIKDYLLSFGNPVIDGLVRAMLSPVFLDPAKKAVKVEAAKLLTGKSDLTAARVRIRAAARPIAQRLSAALGRSRSQEGAHALGDPVWDLVRLKMAAGVEHGLRKPVEIQNDARAMSRQFSKVGDALRLLLANAPGAKDKGERAFRRYLRQNADYAALWGYGVIAFTPPGYANDLKAISIHQIGSRGEVRLGDLGTMPANPSTARLIYERHGPYPVDGYTLYFQKTQPGTEDAAAAFYGSGEVEGYVGKYCPA
jgi:hypothetical protein